MMEKVQWKIEGIFKADAQKCYEEMGDATITPEEVLEKANNKKSELHKCFEWDDAVAGHKYRLEQARKLIQLIVVTPVSEEHTPMRVYQITTTTNTYQPTKLFLQQPDEYQALLKRAKDELKSFKQRYKSLTELEEIFEAIDAL